MITCVTAEFAKTTKSELSIINAGQYICFVWVKYIQELEEMNEMSAQIIWKIA